ncbi:hypothetical protein [Salinicoccus albus]|uniref:hypothetical protein n=1 Tax=Salinicoccus albus TaxID=418756 RepID=UPI0006846B75|nr:hypothetical protein [Salinicoccus albus]
MTDTVSFRNARRHSFTQVSNSLLNDSEITVQAKGLLIIFLSNTEDWKIQMKEIITRSKNGRDAHYKMLNELIKHGYVARVEYRDKKTKRYVKQEYIFSDNKDEVKEVLEEIEKLADEQNLNAVFSYKIDNDKEKKKPDTENQETEEKEKKNPFPDFPDTEKSNPESQDINNIKENNTKYKNTNNNLNNVYNLKKEDDTENLAGHSSYAGNFSQQIDDTISEDQYNKEMSFNKYPKSISLELQRLHYDDAKLLMDIFNKAKNAVSREYDDMKNDFDFTYESHNVEISKIMNRMIQKAKFDNVSINYLSRYISRSVQNYFRNYAEEELQEIIEQDMKNSSFKL